MKQLTSAQMAEWAAYFRIEPDADSRVDSLLAQQLAMLGNINRSEDKVEPFMPQDFMPWSDQQDAKLEAIEEPIDAKTQEVRLKALFSTKGKI